MIFLKPYLRYLWGLSFKRNLSAQHSTNNKSGFTLIELITVIALICVIAGLGVMQSSMFSKITARSELNKLQTVCLYLQSLARSKGEIEYLTFTPSGYRFDDQTVEFNSGIVLGCRNGICGPPSKPLYAILKPCSFAHNRVEFHPDGIISAGVVYINGCDGTQYALSSGVSEISYLRSYQYTDTWRQLE